MATYQEQLAALEKKKKEEHTKMLETLRDWLLSGIVDGIAPLVIDNLLTETQAHKVIHDIMESLRKNTPF